MSIRTTSRLATLDAAFVRVRRLWESPALRRRFTAALGVSVDPGVLRTLRAVANLETCGVREVAEELDVEASTASRLVDAAVSAGYLDRATSPEDRRRSVLSVTASGARLLRRALDVREHLLSELTDGWSDEDIETLATLLARLGARVAELEKP